MNLREEPKTGSFNCLEKVKTYVLHKIRLSNSVNFVKSYLGLVITSGRLINSEPSLFSTPVHNHFVVLMRTAAELQRV